jgi:DNA-binding CsgD family transcriptional regulator
MLTRERRSLHREIAEALEKQKNRAGSRVLAEHYLRAGLPDRARPFALKEAENARRVAAFREERYYLQIGLENLPEDDPERLSAEHRLGLLSLSLLDIPATFKWLSRAKDGFQRIGRARKAASVLVNLSFLYWFWSPSQLPGLLQELENFARVTLEEPEQDLEALHVYSQTAFSLTGNDNHRRALEWVKRSYEVAAGIDDPMKYGSLQFSALAQGVAQTDSSAAEAEMGLAAIRGVLEFALKYNLPEMALVSYGNLMPALVYLGRTVEAAQLRQELTDYENRTGTARMSNMKALSYFFEGNWAEIIEELGREKEQSISPTVKALHRVAYAGFLIERGDLALAQTELEAALPVTELHQYSYRAPTLWYCGRLYAAMHDSRKAHEYFDRFYELWKTSDDRGLVIPALLDGILFFVADNSLVKARRWLADLKEISIQTGSPVARAALWEAEAELARAEGAHRDAPEFLTKALQGWVELGWKYRQALVSERLARLKLQSSQSGKDTRLEADELLGFASEIYRILNIQPRLAGIDNLRQETRLDTQSKRRATLEASRAPHQGLTRREFQVLVHISAGMTNREIAESLSISVGTVELHVNRVLGKLGCDTRTQAAAYAVEKGWTKSELNL